MSVAESFQVLVLVSGVPVVQLRVLRAHFVLCVLHKTVKVHSVLIVLVVRIHLWFDVRVRKGVVIIVEVVNDRSPNVFESHSFNVYNYLESMAAARLM